MVQKIEFFFNWKYTLLFIIINIKMHRGQAKYTETFKAPFLKNTKDFTVEDYRNTEEIEAKYEEWGFVVIKNILSREECKEAEQLIYDDLIGYFIKIKKVVVTWTSQAVPHLSTNHA